MRRTFRQEKKRLARINALCYGLMAIAAIAAIFFGFSVINELCQGVPTANCALNKPFLESFQKHPRL